MKKIVLGSIIAVAGLAFLVVLAFRISPWPSVLILQHIFSGNDEASMAALEKHVPADVAERLNLAYGNNDDEIFDIYYPENSTSQLPTIVWTHGGAWIGGSKRGVRNYLKILAHDGYTVVGLDYTTAPTAAYPTPVKQVNAALAHLLANAEEYNVDPQSIVLAGDSAGSQITAQVANIATSPEYASLMNISPSLDPEQIKGLLLFCGAYNLHSIDLTGDFSWFLNTVLWAYTGTKNFMNDPEVNSASVLNYVTAQFPPAFITGGNDDPLTPQSVALADKLKSLGVSVDAHFFPADHTPALPHEFQFDLDNADGMATLERTRDFLQTVVGDTRIADTRAHDPSKS